MTLTISLRSILADFAKCLPKDSPRSYGKVIGIRAGQLALTDGFCLLRWRDGSLDHLGETVLARDLFPSEVKFPAWEQIPKPDGQVIQGEPLVELARCVSRKLAKHVYLIIDPSGKTTLEAFPTHRDGYAAFKPEIVAQYLQAIPKGMALHSAKLCDDGDQLQLYFGEEAQFMILACATKLAEGSNV